MFLFGQREKGRRCGAIIDIGSGSVLVAIVISDANQPVPQIVWSHREQTTIKNIESLTESSKAVVTALVNAMMKLESEGRPQLQERYPKQDMSDIHCTISAPWSYTVTETINYSNERAFVLTSDLIAEFDNTITNKVASDFNENQTLKELKLETIATLTMDLSANGYHIPNPIGSKVTEITFSQSHAVAEEYMLNAIAEVTEKLIPDLPVRRYSFMLVFYSVVRELLNHTYDTCLVDVTYEATEIGVVRNGILNYCTHTPYGSYSLAREISAITQVPLTEAFGYLHESQPLAFINNLPVKQQIEIERLFDVYTDEVARLFKQTGDSLTIPKNVSLHANLRMEPLFTQLIAKAAKRSTKSEVDITSVTEHLGKNLYSKSATEHHIYLPKDTALALSAQFFHTKANHDKFKL
jgi:hypothetical protein